MTRKKGLSPEKLLILENIERFRKERGIETHDDLAKISGVSSDTLKKYARKIQAPAVDEWIKLARALYRPLEDFVTANPPAARAMPATTVKILVERKSEETGDYPTRELKDPRTGIIQPTGSDQPDSKTSPQSGEGRPSPQKRARRSRRPGS